MAQEYEWAEALRRAKQEASRSDTLLLRNLDFPTNDKITMFQEQLDYYKNKLKEALAAKKNRNQIEFLIDKIITLLAKLTTNAIHEEKEMGATDSSEEVQRHLQKYFSDCTFLLAMIPPQT